MGYLFKKYEFNSEAQADEKIAALGTATDEDGNEYPTHKHTVVKLGYLWVTEPTYDEDGNVETEGVASDMYSVDVLWSDLDIISQKLEGIMSRSTVHFMNCCHNYAFAM